MSLVAQMIPFAIGAATNPAAIAVELLILSGATRPKIRTWAYLIGFLVGLLVFTVVAYALLGRLADSGTGHPSTSSRIISGIIAVGLLVVGVRTLLPRKGPAKPSKFAARIAAAKTPAFFGIGVLVMATDASSMVLLLPALHIVSIGDDATAVKLTAIAVLLLITVIPLLLPIAAVTVAGKRADPVLAKVSGFVSGHQRVINGIVILIIAALVGYKAL